MKYTILSINDDRAEYKKVIRERVPLVEVEVPAFDASKKDPVAELEGRGFTVHSGPEWHPKRGELGIWISTINAWEYCIEHGEDLVVFEDDAVPFSDFNSRLISLVGRLPHDWGFMALWVPDDQHQDYHYYVDYDKDGKARILGSGRQNSQYHLDGVLAFVYQGYGGVAVLYSPRGAQELLDQVKQRGLYCPVDCFIYMMSNAQHGTVGYAPAPNTPKPVGYDWLAPTTVHHTERV